MSARPTEQWLIDWLERQNTQTVIRIAEEFELRPPLRMWRDRDYATDYLQKFLRRAGLRTLLCLRMLCEDRGDAVHWANPKLNYPEDEGS